MVLAKLCVNLSSLYEKLCVNLSPLYKKSSKFNFHAFIVDHKARVESSTEAQIVASRLQAFGKFRTEQDVTQ